MSRYFVAGLPPLKNSTSCTIGLRHLLIGSSRKDAVKHIDTYCPDSIRYPEQSVVSPVLKMFYNKSRIVSFYDKQNFQDGLSKLTADVFCLQGRFMCNGTLTMLNTDNCWTSEVYPSFTTLLIFPIPDLFCQIAKYRQQSILQRSVFAIFILILKSVLIQCFLLHW
jgi:hypothetical protein